MEVSLKLDFGYGGGGGYVRYGNRLDFHILSALEEWERDGEIRVKDWGEGGGN